MLSFSGPLLHGANVILRASEWSPPAVVPEGVRGEV